MCNINSGLNIMAKTTGKRKKQQAAPTVSTAEEEEEGLQGQEEQAGEVGCAICNHDRAVNCAESPSGSAISSTASMAASNTQPQRMDNTHMEEQQQKEEPSFALRCNSCRKWYHPWCLGYQLDLDRGCMVTAAEIDIPLEPDGTGLPAVSQWFCDSCASIETGVVACLAKRSR